MYLLCGIRFERIVAIAALAATAKAILIGRGN